MSSIIEPLCEKCGTDAAATHHDPIDDYRVRCGQCGHVFVPCRDWDVEDAIDQVRELLVELERQRAAGSLPDSLEHARQGAFTTWLNLAYYAVRDQILPAHELQPITMADGVRWELDGRTTPPQIVPTKP